MRIYKHSKDGQSDTKKWYADIRLHNGKRCRLPLFEKERLSLSFGAKIQELLNLKAANETPGEELQRWINDLPSAFLGKLVRYGILQSTRAAGAVSLENHLKDFRDYLKHKGNTWKYAEKMYSRIDSILTGCKILTLADVSASHIQKYLSDEIAADKIGRKTANHYISAIKGFFSWLIQDGRAHVNPIGHIARFDTAKDDKRQRRALTADEMRHLLSTTAKGETLRGITGFGRAMHYEAAAMTGLRAAELRALTVGDFDFKANVVRLAGRHTKNRQDATIPLKPEFAERLKIFLSGKPLDCPAFKTAASAHEVRVLRKDLDAAGIPEVDESGRVFDFHSFRVFFASMLAQAGTNPKTAMELLRHSDIRLTMNIYSMAYRESLTAAVDALPNLTVAQKKKAAV